MKLDIGRYISEELNLAAAQGAVRETGVYVAEALLAPEIVALLVGEFGQLFLGDVDGVAEGNHPAGRLAKIDLDGCSEEVLPGIVSVFGSPAFRALATWCTPQGSVVQDQVIATHDVESMSLTDTHFDSLRTLKFLVYLLDTDESNGAFCYAARTHTSNAAYREEFLRRGGELMDLQNVAAETEDVKPVSICGRAGTVIVFDTDGFHSGGRIAGPGKERKVLRSRTVFAGQPQLVPKRFTTSWIRRRFGVFPPQPPMWIPGRKATGGRAVAQ